MDHCPQILNKTLKYQTYAVFFSVPSLSCYKWLRCLNTHNICVVDDHSLIALFIFNIACRPHGMSAQLTLCRLKVCSSAMVALLLLSYVKGGILIAISKVKSGLPHCMSRSFQPNAYTAHSLSKLQYVLGNNQSS